MPPSEQNPRLSRETLEELLFTRSRGRCECLGICGHNHRWDPESPPGRCNATHGVNIVRKKGHPSCVWNAPLQGFVKHEDGSGNHLLAPRTHERGKYVLEGVKSSFAHPEHFEMKKIGQVWLTVVQVNNKGGEEGHQLLCQFCIHQAREKGALPS